MTTLQAVELGVLGPLRVRQDGAPVAIPGAKPRAVLTMLGLHHGSVVSADTLVELLWGEDPPRTAAKALQTHISALRRALGDGFVLTQGTGWALAESEVDAPRYKSAARLGRDAAATGDISQAVAHFEAALALWRGIPELPDGRRGASEKTRWIEGHAALVEDRADALLATARAAEIIGELEAAVAEAPLRERRWGQLMLALYRAGRQGDALAAYQRARTMLAEELGIDPGPELRRLEAAIVAQDASLDVVVAQNLPSVMRAVTFLLTDIEGSTAAWEADAAAMALALARHDELAEQVVTSRGGRLIKTRGEGDATFSVFERPSAAAAAAMELQDAISREQWNLREPMRIRIALHTGEVELRDGDYFGRAVNRAARLRSLAAGGQILCSGATAELVVDSLPDDVVLADLGLRELRNLARPEHVFELRLETAEELAQPPTNDAPPMERPGLPPVLIGTGPFVGRASELERLLSAWQTSLGGGACAALIAGEPGVGKTRLAGEWSRQAYEQGAVVLYGRCDEDLGAPYQPFAEALRSLVPCVGTSRLRGLRGVEALLPLVPGLADEVPDLAAPTRADPDTERYALFDAVVALLEKASTETPVVLVLDDLHWAAKPTLLLLRHLLRFGDRARVQIVGTYRSTDLDRSHPLAAMLADLHRDGTANRINLSGLDEDDVSAYVAKAGYDDEELGHALASVTGGNPFFLIEALRHVDESGGVWDPSTLPQGVREAVSRRLSRLPIETNKALAAAAVVGSRFALDLVEKVVEEDLVDAFDEACKAGIVVEEPGGRYRFNHAIVRQSLLAELPSMRRMRLHQRIATTLEDQRGDDDELLAELAHHYFECAWAGNAAKAVEYCRRAADQAMARLAYEGAAELYDHAVHAMEELDDELPDRDDQVADLLVARCEALLAAGDVASAASAVSQLQQATVDSARLSAWATCFDGQLSVLVHPERLDDVEAALDAAAHKLAEIDDAAGEAKAHTVRATCLARLGRIGDCEIALDDALTAARRAREHRRVNAVLAGAPLAALWGPNPVPRAGGRCLDVVRLLRITTDSPAVEATSTRCQAVLEAFRGRDAAARRMIDSARRTVTELGLRHALLEVEQFAGIVELVLDDPAAAEPHLRQAYNGFRRMGLDADTAETAALLGRACLALNRDAEADELCTESERLAGHALKASIAWRTLRARLLSRGHEDGEARRVAQAAITLAERTDGLVDHGDACLSLAMVLAAAGDTAGARAAAERSASLYERKGAAALADKARRMLDERAVSPPPAPPEAPVVETRTAAVQASERVMAAIAREAWDEFEQMFAPAGSVESRRKVVGFKPTEFASDEVIGQTRRDLETGIMTANHVVMAVRGERLALARMTLGTVDVTPGAPQDEFLHLYRVDEQGRIALQIWFDLEDMDAAIAELDAAHARFEDERPPARRAFGGRELPSPPMPPETPKVELDTACVRAIGRLWDAFDREAWDEVEGQFATEIAAEYRRKIVGFSPRVLSPADWARQVRTVRAIGGVRRRHAVVAIRGDRLALTRFEIGSADTTPGAPREEALHLFGLDNDGRIALHVGFDVDDMNAALAELDALHARFEDERPQARRLENTASRVIERVYPYYAARDWDALAQMTAENYYIDDRRRTANAGIRHGRDAGTRELQATAEVGFTMMMVGVVATRGERLALTHIRASGRDPGAIQNEALNVVEIDADEKGVAAVVFDLEDFDAAIAELDARYLAGEAAAHARTWSVTSGTYASVRRHEFPAITPDCVTIDHRRTTPFGPGELSATIRAGWDLGHIRPYVEVVHRLSDLGAVCSYAAHGVSHQGFDAEWQGVNVVTVEGDMANRTEFFDEADLDAAIARFEELSQPARRLENAASRVFENEWSHFAARDWDALAELVADNYSGIDHRRVVRAENQHGRDVVVKDLQAAADVGFTISMVSAMAIRGERLVLARVRASGRDPNAIQNDALNVIEIDAEERIVAAVTFDLEDFDAAIAELESRYITGEAAAHAHTWSVVAAGYAGFNRRELLATTPDWVSIDHRRGAGFAPGDMIAYIQAAWDDSPDTKIYIGAVHRLSEIGAVVTHLARGISQEGFDAEWRDVHVLAVEGEMFSRAELFDEADLDAAIARFEDLNRPARQLENAASRANERTHAYFAARDWDSLAEIIADDISTDDRRRVVNTGLLHGRDASIESFRWAADLGVTHATSDPIATRGERLVLTHDRYWRGDENPEALSLDLLQLVEIDAEERIVALVTFDADDFPAAIAELDARYLAGQAAAHARTWSVIMEGYASLNRRELPPTTPDWVNIDHRRGTSIAPGGIPELLTAAWNVTSDLNNFVEAVHRLDNLGGVVTHVANETSQEGFHAEWRVVSVFTVDGDMVNRCEVFDEAAIDDAIARFEQLSRPATRLENAASRAAERHSAHFAARDWDALAQVLAEDILVDDRRRVVNAGIKRGRDAEIANLRAVADVGITYTAFVVIAARGERLILTRASVGGVGSAEFSVDQLSVVEINSDNQIAAIVIFELDDFDSAIAELDTRYLAGEAAAHAHTWSVIAGGHAALNRHELPPTTPDCVSIDHRRGAAFAPGDLIEYFRAGWELGQDIRTYVEVVHRLSELGAVCTHAGHGISHEGFDAEWHGVDLLTVEGDMVSRCEAFDDADLDAALARFEELSRPTPRLENTASRANARFVACANARDWDAIASILAADHYSDDRRRVTGAGTRRGPDADIEHLQVLTELGATITVEVIATRGDRLILTRTRVSFDQQQQGFLAEALTLVETDLDGRIAAVIAFDLEDIEAAFEELDARYLAGEAAAHSHAWSVIMLAYSALNRREMPPTTPDWVNIDHRRGTSFAPGQLPALLASWELASVTSSSVEVVHRLDNLGAVISSVSRETSQEGLEAEWWSICVITLDRDLIDRLEVFDEGDLDAALARFDQLGRSAPRLENTASRANARLIAHFNARDWDSAASILADDHYSDDRRRVTGAGIRRGPDADIENFRVIADLGVNITVEVIATRGDRLALTRARAEVGEKQQPFIAEFLGLVETDLEGRVAAVIELDLEDIEAAFEELDARYLAGEAAVHAHTWSAVTNCYAAMNRREIPATTTDFVNIDHRKGTPFAPGDLIAYAHASWSQVPDISYRIETVHQLSDLGAVITHTVGGTSQEGFEAEWREIHLITLEGDLFTRSELFDEADIHAALAKFDQLSRPAQRLENAASQVTERFAVHLRARDWDAMAELLADDFCSDDRRGVVGAGIQHGRDAHMADMRTIVDLWITKVSSTIIATRGERLALTRTHFSGSDQGPGAFLTEVFGLVEIDTDERIVAIVSFDLEDIDAAFAELDARYLAGEAAAHSRTWSVVAGAYAALNRHEFPATTPDWVNIDHRGETMFGPGDLIAHLRARLDFEQDFNIHTEAVHRLTDLGAVVTYAAHATSQEGFEAEWRGASVFAVEGDMVNRWEVFDEADLEAALASFEKLSRPVPRLENAASRVGERYLALFAAGNWDAMPKILADDFCNDDRRPMVGSGVLVGRDAQIANDRAIAELWTTSVTSTVMATRGSRLALTRLGFSGRDEGPEAFLSEMLTIAEINADERIVAVVSFGIDDFEAAIAELDARYLAGEAAAHARTWSLVAAAYECYNRRELPPTTPDWVNVDRRRMTMYPPGDVFKYVRGGWDYISDISFRIEAVHQLNDLGAVVTHTGRGTSQEGFDAEWREIHLMTVEGDLFNRSEMFDEADVDEALARFDELHPQTPRLENAASRVDKRFQACFASRDWDAMAEMMSGGFAIEDRRRVVNMGNLHGRDAEIGVHAYAVAGTQNVNSAVIATRAQRLALNHYRFSGGDQSPDAFSVEMLAVVEIDADERMAVVVVFDVDDFDAAIADLDARYLAGEAAAYSETWLVIAEVYAALSCAEMPTTASDFVDIDHRSLAAIGSGDLMAYVQAALKDARRHRIYIETVHRLTDLGAVITHVANATSREGFDAEWRLSGFFVVGGDVINRYEIFDEADLDTAIARFDQLSQPAARLENAAAQAYERIHGHFAARDWDGLAETLADAAFHDDRRRVVGAGLRKGSGAVVAEFAALAEIGVKRITFDTVAIRGDRLVLCRSRASGRDPRADAFRTDVLSIGELDADGRFVALITFDPDDFDAAIAELDARYLAGEAAPYSAVWSVVMQGYAALNQHERPLMTPDVVSVDHRRGRAFAPGDLPAFIDATWDVLPQSSFYIDYVHRLNDIGVVVTHVVHGTTAEGFDAEWRQVTVLKLAGDCMSHCEMFDEEDLDAALARFEELHPPTPRLENPASQVTERFQAHFAARDWAAMGEILADGFSSDDRRRVVGAGVRDGRHAEIADIAATADLGITNVTSTVVATRGGRLALMRGSLTNRDQGPESFLSEALGIVEINADERIVAFVTFDLDDIDAAFAELEARYLAGEAAAHAQTWSLVVAAYAAFDRHELPAADWVTVDHRRATPFASSTMTESLRAIWDLTPALKIHIEAVHRLNSFGAVITHEGHGSSQEGFDAEWRAIDFLTIEGDRITGCEIFDEEDLDAAFTRFDELQTQARRVENAASRVYDRFQARFAAHDWVTISQMLADDVFTEDRRPVVNLGRRRGRDAVITEISALSDVGVKYVTSDIIATRGEYLLLSRTRSSGRDQRPDAFQTVDLDILEVDAEGRCTARIVFDLNDIDAAFAELDARYLTGEAAEYQRTWSTIAGMYASFNRHELPATTPDWVTVDRRPVATFEFRDASEFFRSTWDLTPDVRIYAEAVHRLTGLGAVVTHVVHGTSEDGFDAEWRISSIVTVKGDLISGCELFDEADLDAALARFEELHPRPGRLEHPVQERFLAHFAARDWDAMGQDFADDYYCDDRRRVVNAGVRHGRDAALEDLRVAAEIGLMTNITSEIIATRGKRLFLGRTRWLGPDQRPEDFHTEVLNVVVVDPEERIAAQVLFDPNDIDNIDAAFAELDARYLAGEAAAHSHTWTALTQVQAAYNRHEFLPTTENCVNIDHRRGRAFAPGDMIGYIRATYDIAPNVKGHIEAVHRLTNLGAVATEVVTGTSQEGFDAEWREIGLFAFEGDLICRFEMFDEADLDAALARFDELHSQARRLENTATQVDQRFWSHFPARDWDAMAGLLADGISTEDRRRVVSAGVRQGRDDHIAEMRAVAEVGTENIAVTVMATRGARLALTRICGSTRETGAGEFSAEVVNIVEIDAENRISARVAFDSDDLDAAFAELDARYLAGEAAPYAHIWTAMAQVQAAYNRHEVPPATADWVNIDHRRGRAFAPGDTIPYLRATYDVAPDLKGHIEAVHQLNNLGVVITEIVTGTSQEGFGFEWREIGLFAFEGDMVCQCELFDEADLDAALARFDELRPQAPRLENAASHIFSDDRRRVVNGGIRRGRGDHMADMRGIAEVLPDEVITPTVIATRGARLALTRISGLDRGRGLGEVTAELFSVVELDADNRIVSHSGFDVDDIDAAIAELDARYLAGEAAPFANTWSAVAGFYAALNRHEILATPDWVNVDHRRATTVASGDMAASIRATWDLAPNITRSVEAVHRLDNLGAVVAHTAYGTSREGFDAEWRLVALLTFMGDLISRCELFDETDLDAALARFDELHTQVPRLENAATQLGERQLAHFAARDWAAMTALLADDISTDDRRRVVNAGNQHGRDVDVATMRALADLGVAHIASTVIATRGERLALTRSRMSGRDQRPDAFYTEALSILEIDADNRGAAKVVFDPDDIDSAIKELDARYLAGEAADYAHTWSVMMQACAALNTREIFATTADFVDIDHRSLAAIESGDLKAYIRAALNDGVYNVYIEAVHRLGDLGAVVTLVSSGTSQRGFDGEWRMADVFTVEGDLISRCEIFNEADLDAALARFEELQPQAPRLENAAIRVTDRLFASFAAGEWDSIREILANDFSQDDRRRVVGAGVRRGRDDEIADLRAIADLWSGNATGTYLATRGERLDLMRLRFSLPVQGDEAFVTEVLGVGEINAEGRIVAAIAFDPDDIDAAYEELDARYLAGEAAAYAHTWSVITRFNGAFNRHEIPPTDWVTIDHRRLITADTSDQSALIHEVWNITPDLSIHIEAVHRLSGVGAVVTRELHGTSQDGFDAEWRMIQLLTVEGDQINRSELFDEADLDAALARFQELQSPTPPRDAPL